MVVVAPAAPAKANTAAPTIRPLTAVLSKLNFIRILLMRGRHSRLPSFKRMRFYEKQSIELKIEQVPSSDSNQPEQSRPEKQNAWRNGSCAGGGDGGRLNKACAVDGGRKRKRA